MKNKEEKKNIMQYSKSIDKNLKLINKNKELKEIIPELNNINNNIIRYNQIEKLLKYNSNNKTPIEIDIKENDNNINNKDSLLEEIKLIQNRLYKSKNQPNNFNNIKLYKNHIKEVMNNIFRKSELKRKYYPKSFGKLKQIKNLKDLNSYLSEKNIRKSKYNNKAKENKDICLTERNDINDYNPKNKYNNNKTIETEKSRSINYMNYASNCIKYKHPQFYLLNVNSISKKKLPPLKVKKVNTIDLLNKNNNTYFQNLNKLRKFDKYVFAMKFGALSKFKVNQ